MSDAQGSIQIVLNVRYGAHYAALACSSRRPESKSAQSVVRAVEASSYIIYIIYRSLIVERLQNQNVAKETEAETIHDA